jgi:hypothetical protein
LEDPGVDGKIILRWIFRKWDVGAWIGSSWLWIGTERSTYGGEEMHIQGFGEEPEGKKLTGRSGEDGKIILRWIFRKWDVEAWIGSSWLRIRTGGGALFV